MKWFFRWFQKGLDQAAQEYVNNVPQQLTAHEDLGINPLRLRIFRANGGTVIETRQYDRNDREQVQLHIIGHEEDLSHSIAKIITMETLRQ